MEQEVLADAIEGTLSNISFEINLYEDHVSDKLQKEMSVLGNLLLLSDDTQKSKVKCRLYDEIDTNQVYIPVYLFSFMVFTMLDKEIMKDFLRFLAESKKLKTHTLNFLFWQIENLIFNHMELEDMEIRKLHWRLFQRVCMEFYDLVGMELKPIAEAERDGDFVIVITEQFLKNSSGPTKTALDRCKTLIDCLNKKILLINTAELSSLIGVIPFYECKIGNYKPELLEESENIWHGTRIPYLQCYHNMPDIETIKTLLSQIASLKPKFIVQIGANSILANLADKMIPVITVGCTTSEILPTMTRYQISNQKLSLEEKEILADLNISENSVIEGRFTFSLDEQQEHFHRVELGLEENKFILVVVGSRLDQEVTGEFAGMLEGLPREKFMTAFIGNFTTYDEFLKNHPKLKHTTKNMGFWNNPRAVIELCDLYVNPVRKGGGTSCVEAMEKGLPVVTMEYGDVAHIAGSEFSGGIKTYEEMRSLIEKYAADQSFYKEQAGIAKNKASKLMDSQGEFIRILEEMEKRERGNQ